MYGHWRLAKRESNDRRAPTISSEEKARSSSHLTIDGEDIAETGRRERRRMGLGGRAGEKLRCVFAIGVRALLRTPVELGSG